MGISIWWIRRDLRLNGNQALATSAQGNRQVFPLFVIDPRLIEAHHTGKKRVAFMFDALRSLDRSLRIQGSQLTVRVGLPHEVIPDIAREIGAEEVVAESDFGPFAQRRDAAVSKRVSLRLVDGSTICPPRTILKANGEPFRVFAPYLRSWLEAAASTIIPATNLALVRWAESRGDESIEQYPRQTTGARFEASEDAAFARLERFTSSSSGGILTYRARRNRLDVEGGSGLSAYLRFGLISPRLVAERAFRVVKEADSDEQRSEAQAWLSELAWRDFYTAILHHFPHVTNGPFNPALDSMVWRNNPDDFVAWSSGKTGYPAIDAPMRQLKAQGWIANRARMMVASFLTKHLLIDWRWGERWFMQTLVDGDLASNNGGWQWVSGTGANAAPYFRIFNPVEQGKRYDPEGHYIREWVPELASLPSSLVHEPWKLLDNGQPEDGVRIGTDYPKPIVDLAEARRRALAAHRSARSAVSA